MMSFFDTQLGGGGPLTEHTTVSLLYKVTRQESAIERKRENLRIIANVSHIAIMLHPSHIDDYRFCPDQTGGN